MTIETATLLAPLLGAIPGILAALLAGRADRATRELDRLMRIRQARLDERDLIQAAGGPLIPVGDDSAWLRYYDTVAKAAHDSQYSPEARKSAAKEAVPLATRPAALVAAPLDRGD